MGELIFWGEKAKKNFKNKNKNKNREGLGGYGFQDKLH